MHQERKSLGDTGSDWVTPGREDSIWQGRVMSALLEHYPHQLSELEIARELLTAEPGFAERDALERAVEDLCRVGLLQRCEAMVSLTRAARHFDSLPMDE
jgi:hypothetical protein